MPVNRRLTSMFKIASAVLVRIVLVIAIYAVPLVLAGFAEWSSTPAVWAFATRSLVAVIWLALTAGFFLLIFSDGGVRKAGG